MATKLPSFPKQATYAAFQKVKVKEPKYTAKGEWLVSFDGSKTLKKSVDDLTSAYAGINADAFKELAAAIKSGEDVIAKYQALGNEFTKVDAYKKLADSFAKAAAKKARAFKGDSKYDKLGKWYEAVGTKVLAHATTVEQLGDTLLEQAENVDTAKITDLKWDLNTWDLTHTLKSVIGADYKYIKLKDKYQIAISVTGKVGAEAANNATLRAEFFEAAYEVGKRSARKLHNSLTEIENRMDSGAFNRNQALKAIAGVYDQFSTDYEKVADKAIQAKWNEFTKNKKDYRKYKIKTGFKIFGKAAGLGVGVATTAAAGWTGVGTVMGGAAAFKSAAELGSTCYDAWISARKLKGQIDDAIKALQDRFANADVASAQEVGGATLEALTGIRTNTVATVTNKVKLFGDKIKGCHANAVKMGRKIDVVIKETSGLKRKIAKGQKELAASTKAVRAFGKLEKQLEKFEGNTDQLLTKASDAAADYREGKAAIAGYVKDIKALQGDINKVANFLNTWAVPVLKFAFVSDGPGAIATAGSVTRDWIAAGTKTTDELAGLNEAGDLAGNVGNMITGILGS